MGDRQRVDSAGPQGRPPRSVNVREAMFHVAPIGRMLRRLARRATSRQSNMDLRIEWVSGDS